MPAPQAEPEAEPDPRQDARHAIYRELLELHRDVSAQMPGLSFSELLKKRYGPSESKDLTLAQLRDLVLHLRGLLTEGPRALPEAPPPARERREPKLVTQAQVTRLFTLVGYRGWTEADLRTYLEHVFQLDSTRALNVRQYDQLCRVIETSSFAVAIAEFEKRGGHAQKSQR